VLTWVAVVVPAHDEQDLLPACLAFLTVAAAAVALPVRVIVALDACADATGALAVAAGARTVTLAARNVGAARRAGMAAALAGHDPATVWLATTDADSRVPADWLAGQLAHAAAGAEVVVGTVAVEDWAGWPAGLAGAYRARYRGRVGAAGHDHVHGANLGMTGTAYRAAGGFPARRAAEDRAFVARAVRAGRRVVWATDLPVLTSSRPVARVATGGFSGHLRRLAAEYPLAE
jgi:glycosyltransferase involved in cell wall biosynthesis